MIYLEINGVRYIEFESINVERSIENINGTFNFVATSAAGINFPIKRRAPCRVLVNQTPILTGYVEKINIKVNQSSHNITVSGRDSTADIYDSQVDGLLEFNPPVTLETVIKQTAKSININNINVINEAGNIAPFQPIDIVSSRVGQTAFNFIETYSRKRQVFVTSDGQGNIVIARGSNASILLGGIYNQIGDPYKKNNILDATIDFDDTNRFNVYKCYSQTNPIVLNLTADTTPEQITNQTAGATDTQIRKSRVLNFNSESSSFSEDVKQRAAWEANIRRARSFTYTAVVQGDSYDGINPWRVNRLVQVIDDDADISANLLIKSLSFKLSNDSGTTTTLQLVTPDGYTPEPNLNEQSGNNLGKGYVFKVDN